EFLAYLLFLTINQARTQDFFQRCIVLVAILLQERQDILPEHLRKRSKIAYRSSLFEQVGMPNLQIAGITSYIFADAFIQSSEPGTEWYLIHHRVTQDADV